MGNAAMCAPSMTSHGVIKVLLSDGRLEIYTRPVKAAELMVENPGQFICESTHLKVGQRIPGLLADDELELRQVYFVLPMDMLYSVLTHEELKAITYRASKAMRHGSLKFGKIFPVCMFPSEPKTLESPESQPERFSRQRSWIPALETIVETPPRRPPQ